MERNEKTVFVNYEKLNSDTGDSNITLEQLYMELGKTYYEGRFEDPLPELLPFFDQITQLRAQENKRTTCPECGYKIEEDAVFCGNCGFRLK